MANQQAQPQTSGPSFENPPVFETAMSVQFEELKGFNAVHFGRIYEIFRDHFPIPSDRPRLPRVVESFPRKHRVRQLKLDFLETPATNRMFFSNETDTALIQVQPDRFGFNWKRHDASQQYPRYSTNSERFSEYYRRFVEFCDQEELGKPKEDICEVVYVNRIMPEKGESTFDLFSHVFAGASLKHSDEYLPAPTSLTLNRVYDFQDMRGRLYVEANVAVDISDNAEFLNLKMVGRINVREDRPIENLMKQCHDWIVNGFVSVTNEKIRDNRWGQIK